MIGRIVIWSLEHRLLVFLAAAPVALSALMLAHAQSGFFQQGRPGLGQRILDYQTNMQYPQLYTAIIVSSLLGIAIFTLFGWIGQRAIRSWHESAVDNR